MAVLLTWRYYDPGWKYPVKGVDVSHHQGDVDWVALAAEDVAFAYIKATEGIDWVDDRFAVNWRGAAETGILRGAYHFFTLCSPGHEQAEQMISVVPDATGMLPPAVDLEFAGNCAARPDESEFLDELDDFLTTIEARYNKKPVIYTNADFYRHYLSANPPDVVWWIQTPIVPPWGSPEWSFWQHTPGHMPGVDGDVDRNVFRGDRAALEAMTVGK